ncbi:MAG: ATP-dependent helicase [Thermogutta sp.]
MPRQSIRDQLLHPLNARQRDAVTHGEEPLLIVAGAGTGKTATIVHRVAWQILNGVPPQQIMLLTFTRRAAEEMIRRVNAILRRMSLSEEGSKLMTSGLMAGTFHAVAVRILRQYGPRIGLSPDFTVLDRSDAEDFLDVLRTELKLTEKTSRRFPKKGTCADIYSRMVNAQEPLEKVLEDHFPWCQGFADDLRNLFSLYQRRKQENANLDFDDLLLKWKEALADSLVASETTRRFTRVFVDEYQDTNVLQAEILYRLCPTGAGLTVVGDDAQSIYSFRAATVRNILDFPKHYPDTRIVVLEQNYRSTVPILRLANEVMAAASEKFTKNLWSSNDFGDKPLLIACENEQDQAEHLVHRILSLREEGIDLRCQAVLFRAGHHSVVLEAELTRRGIPYHKYGGLKFLETAHIKDLLSFLKLAENPRDVVAGMRVLRLLPGIGPAKARSLLAMLPARRNPFEAWQTTPPPAATRKLWPDFLKLMESLSDPRIPLVSQVALIREFYEPLLPELYDNPNPRARDLEQVELIASRYTDRRTMLTEITLDPPSSTQDLAADPLLDDDYLILSTIHSAKGLEWDAVYVLNATDGHIPSDMSTRSREEIEEERRLFYVALTRAKRHLTVCHPVRYYISRYLGDPQYGFAQLSRFLSETVRRHMEWRTSVGQPVSDDLTEAVTALTAEGSEPEDHADKRPARRKFGAWN